MAAGPEVPQFSRTQSRTLVRAGEESGDAATDEAAETPAETPAEPTEVVAVDIDEPALSEVPSDAPGDEPPPRRKRRH
jgi:hypothetical protein